MDKEFRDKQEELTNKLRMLSPNWCWKYSSKWELDAHRPKFLTSNDYTTMWFTKKSDQMATYARILLKDQLWFQIGKKEWDERHNDLFDTVSGEFVKVEEGKYTTSEWEERELIKIVLRDDQVGKIIISTAWTGVARNIINSLAWDEKLGKIEMWLYKKAWKDGKYYPNIRLKNNWERMKWKYSIEEQQAMVKEVEFKGKSMRDFTDFEDKLRWEYESINTKSQYSEKPVEVEETEEPTPDLPF